MREQDLQTGIIDYLRLKKYVVVKFPSVGIYDKTSQRYIPYGKKKGVSDLLACSPEGKFFAIEVKIKPNKPTPEQQEFINSINQNNGTAFVAYTIDDIIDRCG